MKSFFTPKEIRELVDISYRQIQYWDKSSFISPSYRRRDKYRLYTFGDLVLLKVAEVLRKHGLSIQQLRSKIHMLKGLLAKISFPLGDLNILFEKDNILLFNGEVLVSPGNKQYILFSVKSLREKLNELYQEAA